MVNAALKRKMKRGNAKFDPRPSTCHACGAALEYGKMESFGIRPFGSGKCYFCPDCGRYVATHKKRPLDALGLPGTAEERGLRAECHSMFDSLYGTTRGRNNAYHALAKELGLRDEDCHFGYMEKADLEKALKIMEKWGKKFR